ncbi:Mth938-like domain-containing protein [Paludibacterium yongneupense]|uniref:Mth938-like domain-containing protein n=1 Tax=Paludibacterium yongneupense TaxID=400061 RepID=UPI0003F98AE3|nr:Mth938-like domain-containing protein [Paludibacterium yongneupense]
MKMHQDLNQGRNQFTGYGEGHVLINRERYEGSLIVTADEIASWDVASFEDLSTDDFARLLDWRPEVVLLGTGERQRFAHPRLSAALAAAGVGLETMSTQAVCRTFNILVAEDRRALAALLP